MCTLGGLLQTLSVCTLEGDGTEQDHHDEVKAPHLQTIIQEFQIIFIRVQSFPEK